MIHHNNSNKGGAPPKGAPFSFMTLTPDQTERLFLMLGGIQSDINTMKERAEQADEASNKLEKRVRTLETNSAKRIGYVAGAAAVASGGVSAFLNLFL